MNQQELDARLAAIGGGELVHSPSARKKTITTYEKVPGEVGLTEMKKEVTVQRWRNPKTGHVIEAYQKADGTWEIERDDPKGSAPDKAPTQPANQTQRPAGGKREIEGTPTGRTNPDGTPEYDNERPRWVTRDKNGNEVFSEPVTGKDLDDWRESRERSRNPGGKTDAEIRADADRERNQRRQDDADQAARDQRNRPTVKIEDDGKGGVVAISVYPDGHTETKPVEGVSGKPQEITHEGRRYRLNPQTGQYEDVTPQTPNDIPIPPGLEFEPDYNQDDLGLAAYNERLLEARRAGKIRREQGLQLLQQAGALAETEHNHGGKRRDQALTQRQQNLSETQHRRTAANDVLRQAEDNFSKYAAQMLPGNGQTAVDDYRATLTLGRANAEDWGGMTEEPNVITRPPVGPNPAMPPNTSSGGGAGPHVVMHPGGAIEINPTGAAAAAAAPPQDPGRVTELAQPGDPGYGAPGSGPSFTDPQTGGFAIPPTREAPAPDAAPPQGRTLPDPIFKPDAHTDRLAELGLTPQEQANVLALYKQGVRADHL